MKNLVVHYAPNEYWNKTACKVEIFKEDLSSEKVVGFIVYSSYNKQDVTCKNCRRTKIFREKS